MRVRVRVPTVCVFVPVRAVLEPVIGVLMVSFSSCSLFPQIIIIYFSRRALIQIQQTNLFVIIQLLLR